MADESWSGAMSAVLDVLRAPFDEILPRLSRVLATVLPHDGLALLAGDCVLMSPLLTHGLDEVTADEMEPLLGRVDVRTPWLGRLRLGGEPRQVLAVAVKPPESRSGMVAIVLGDDAEPSPAVRGLVQQLVEVAVLHLSDMVTGAERVGAFTAVPDTDLADAHAATLTALLGVLRSRRLDDAAARRTAIELAVPALIETRNGGEREAGEERAGEAFGILTDKLSLLTRYDAIALDLVAPEPPGRPLPGVVARAARSVALGAVLAMLQQGGVSRIRVSWQVADLVLRVTVRDDGPATITADALSVHRLRDRLAGLGGVLEADPVPGWGTTIVASVPIAAAGPPAAPLDALNPREHDVLDELALGRRNRAIAERLGISENTVKFHVANILGKLGVTTRGEAAALARGPRRAG
ncbi:LuxR C-terminal-related transcriptional regulator [Nonomuraea sp. B5E05]|uniref:helix-turn-helix transcriptional regulator n=1 Tax=Nonomuraea sp. B5E05 TaxID=3153569 RepID=UPI003260E4DF